MDNRDNWHWASRPSNDADFNEMMKSLDEHLGRCSLIPAHRSLSASRLVSMRLNLSGNHLFPTIQQRGEPFGPSDLLGRVGDWYKSTYGNRLLIDMSPGSVVLQLRGTLWQLALPKIFGTCTIFLDRNLANSGHKVLARGAVPTLNLLLEIDGMTQSYANQLTDGELGHIVQKFHLAWEALIFLDDIGGHDLFHQARADRKAAVEALMSGGQALSRARWDTAQCAEKILKGLLARAGHTFPKGSDGHKIPLLGNLIAEKMGQALPLGDLALIDCPPKVRYREIDVSVQDALSAHDALIRVLQVVRKSSTIAQAAKLTDL
jgi:HEPN domain-containing protein